MTAHQQWWQSAWRPEHGVEEPFVLWNFKTFDVEGWDGHADSSFTFEDSALGVSVESGALDRLLLEVEPGVYTSREYQFDAPVSIGGGFQIDWSLYTEVSPGVPLTNDQAFEVSLGGQGVDFIGLTMDSPNVLRMYNSSGDMGTATVDLQASNSTDKTFQFVVATNSNTTANVYATYLGGFVIGPFSIPWDVDRTFDTIKATNMHQAAAAGDDVRVGGIQVQAYNRWPG